ncbi:MAG TPA: hypothetical protein VHN11_19135, partial [Xanthobacteraceae bacterium]|nr:hypothetical protein [Xanthobacteraceae bacterium]
MNLVLTLLLWSIVFVLAFIAARRERALLESASWIGFREFLYLLPRLGLGVVGSGYLAEVLPQALIASWLGPSSGFTGMVLAWLAGALTPGGPVVGFAIGTTALKSGAGVPQVIVYSIAWALFSLQRMLVYEV